MEKLPDFTFNATSNVCGNLKDLKGHNTLIYFYPKDNTPGCTIEAKNIRDHWDEFTAKNIKVFGVSKDAMKTHENFKAKHEMPFELISDPDTELCQLFGVWAEKSMFGKKYMGIVRASFLFDENGKLIKAWPKVKVKGHAEAVLNEVN